MMGAKRAATIDVQTILKTKRERAVALKETADAQTRRLEMA
jgi:hypothetical protein